MHLPRIALVASFVAGSAASALAGDIRVPQDVKDLKDALLTTQPGDRVIVTGGTWRNGRVMAPGVRLVGRGATLSGLWEVYGTGASIEGCIVRDGHVQIEANDVALRGNWISAPRQDIVVSGGTVSGFTFENNRCARAIVEISDGTGCVIRGNRFLGGSAIVHGDGTLVEDNVLRRGAMIAANYGSNATMRRNAGGFLSVDGMTNADVEQNSPQGIYVRSAGALVADNRIAPGRGLSVEGNDLTVRGNRVSVAIRNAGLNVRGDRLVVTDNVVDNLRANRPGVDVWGLLSVGDTGSDRSAGPSKVLRNEVTHVMLAGIVVGCDDAEVASNTVRGTNAASSLWIVGDRNNVHDNTIVRQTEVDDTIVGIRVEGDENVLADMSLDQAPYDGVVVSGADNLLARVHVGRAGRCGITVDAGATTTGVADCVVEKARWASLYVLGTDTTVTGGSFNGGRKVDVLDLGTGTEFVTATFETKSVDPGLRPYH